MEPSDCVFSLVPLVWFAVTDPDTSRSLTNSVAASEFPFGKLYKDNELERPKNLLSQRPKKLLSHLPKKRVITLDGRTQTTQIGSHISKRQNTTCGVPQGSVLGPLLKLFLFADDTNAVYADKNLKSLESTVNQELSKLFDWLTANKLTLNIQ